MDRIVGMREGEPKASEMAQKSGVWPTQRIPAYTMTFSERGEFLDKT